MKRAYTLYIKDMIDAISSIDAFIADMSFDDFSETIKPPAL